MDNFFNFYHNADHQEQTEPLLERHLNYCVNNSPAVTCADHLWTSLLDMD